MLPAIRLFLACLSMFLFLVEVDPCLAFLPFIALVGTSHYLLWGRAMEQEDEEHATPSILELDPLEMDGQDS
jgi:hypothetical protein